jgi:hypothetical protein
MALSIYSILVMVFNWSLHGVARYNKCCEQSPIESRENEEKMRWRFQDGG